MAVAVRVGRYVRLKYCALLFAGLCLCAGNAYSQRSRQEAELLAYNVGFGIVSTSIGALINKPKHTPVWPYLKRSLWQGALGGMLQYSGKAFTYQITRTNDYWWGWGSKLIHSAGNSICFNASLNKPFGQYWVLDYGPARLNFEFKSGRLQFRPQFNLLFVYDIYNGSRYGHFDLKQTLQLGSVVFQADDSIIDIDGWTALGATFSRSIVLARDVPPATVAHELVHVYQGNEYRIFNSYFNPLVSRIKNPVLSGVFRYVNIDLPYNYIPYMFWPKNHDRYYRNFFEFEAEFFSTNSYVVR